MVLDSMWIRSSEINSSNRIETLSTEFSEHSFERIIMDVSLCHRCGTKEEAHNHRACVAIGGGLLKEFEGPTTNCKKRSRLWTLSTRYVMSWLNWLFCDREDIRTLQYKLGYMQLNRSEISRIWIRSRKQSTRNIDELEDQITANTTKS